MNLPLLAELQRRRVFRALVGYGIAAFAVLQIIEPVMHGLHWPDSVLTYVVVALALGFPLVVALAWIFDVNAGRIERTAPRPASPLRGARLALLLVGIGVLAATPGVVWYLFVRPGAHPPSSDEALRATLDAVPPASDIRAVPSIAVLPFADMSPQKDQEYFSDGMAEEILNALAQVDGLRVIGRSSSFSFKGKYEDLRVIGQKLGVANLLEGSLRKAGGRIRITAQLIESSGGSHLWSQVYDRDLADVFAVQDEIAGAVVAALKVKLLGERKPDARERRTANLEVYNQYLLGRQFFNRSNPEGTRRAVKAFEQALALDPTYAPAWAGLAQASFFAARWLGGTVVEVTEAQERALAAAEKAIALAPEFADGYAARGRVRSTLKRNWKGGQADMERALALNPSDVITLSAFANDVLLPVGQLAQAVAVARKSTVLDPLDAGSWGVLGLTLYYAGQIDEGRNALTRALEISPDYEWAAWQLGIADLLAGQPARALARYKLLSLDWARFSGAALALHDLGRVEESRQSLDALMSSQAENAAYQVAEIYASRGDKDRAFAWLERADAQRDTGLRYVKSDPLLRTLHGDPRYTALLKKMNLPVD